MYNSVPKFYDGRETLLQYIYPTTEFLFGSDNIPKIYAKPLRKRLMYAVNILEAIPFCNNIF